MTWCCQQRKNIIVKVSRVDTNNDDDDDDDGDDDDDSTSDERSLGTYKERDGEYIQKILVDMTVKKVF